MGDRQRLLGGIDARRRAGLAMALACLLVQTASAALPTYGVRETLFGTGGPQPQETASADFNCDGLADVVWVQGAFQTASSYPIRIFLSNGLGGFSDGTSQVITGPSPLVQWPREMVVDDFNGDGRADVFVADTGMDRTPFPGYQSKLLLSTPDCHWTDGTSGLPQQNAITHSAAAADIDGDQDVDLFLGNYWGGQQPQLTPQILLNDGTGQFVLAPNALPADLTNLQLHGLLSAAFEDVDADGDADLLVGADQLSQSDVLLNDGSGRFTRLANAFPAKPFASTAQILDIKGLELNGDGKPDLILAATKYVPYYQGRWLQVLINNGDGTFRDETALRMPQSDNINTWFKFVRIVDIEGDGDLDVVGTVPYQTNVNGGGDHVFQINDGTGHFTPAQLFLPQNGLDGVFAFVDVNGNGHRDFLSIGEVLTVRVRDVGSALPPGIPQSVRASRMLTDRVRVSWPYVWGATQYQIWRSSTPGSAGSQIGTTSAFSLDDLTASTATMYYSVRAVNGAGASTPSTPVPGAVAVPSAPTIVTQPLSQAVLVGGNMMFTVAATGIPSPTYQWQITTDSGMSWTNLSNGAPYSGVRTQTLLVTTATAVLNGVRYRCLATNTVGSVVSNAASVTVTTYLPFSDNGLTPHASVIRAIHITELRTRINTVRARYGLSSFVYSAAAILPGVSSIRAADVTELRTALSQAYAAAGWTAPTYDTSPVPGASVLAADIMQLRAALVTIEPAVSSLVDFVGGLAGAIAGVRFQGIDGPLANGAVVNASSITAGGVTRNGIFVHPPYEGQIGGETFVEYSVAIPAGAILQFSVGVADNAQCTDGVTFRVTAGGTELWNQHVTRTGFHDGAVRLDAYVGTTVPVRFISNPGPAANPYCDWSLWTGLALGTLPGTP